MCIRDRSVDTVIVDGVREDLAVDAGADLPDRLILAEGLAVLLHPLDGIVGTVLDLDVVVLQLYLGGGAVLQNDLGLDVYKRQEIDQ